MFSDEDDVSLRFVFFLSPPVTRVAVEETVETKKVEMKEGVPSKGTAHLNVLLLVCLSSDTKIFPHFDSCLFLLRLLFFSYGRIEIPPVVSFFLFCFIIFCCVSPLHMQTHHVSLVMLTKSVCFKLPKLRKSLKRSQL